MQVWGAPKRRNNEKEHPEVRKRVRQNEEIKKKSTRRRRKECAKSRKARKGASGTLRKIAQDASRNANNKKHSRNSTVLIKAGEEGFEPP